MIVPIRLNVDAPGLEALPTILDAFTSAFERAVTTSMRTVVERRGARPAVGAPPSFTWAGDGLSAVGTETRLRLESAIIEHIRARTQSWLGVPESDSRQAPMPRPEAKTDSKAKERVESTRIEGDRARAAANATWSSWLTIVATWSLAEQPMSNEAAGPHPQPGAAVRAAVQVSAFASRLEGALDFLPDRQRIIADGFVDRPAAAPAALEFMVDELDRGFVTAFVNALLNREFLDWMTDRAIVPLVRLASEPLLRDAFHPEPVGARRLADALLKAFPRTDREQMLGVPLKIDFDRLIARHQALADFRDALIGGQLDPLEATGFTADFVHSLFEALVDAYRRFMRDAVEEIVAIQRVFGRLASAESMPQWQAAKLTEDFDALVGSISGRTPAVAIESGREVDVVRERLKKALALPRQPATEWRADVRPLETGGFVLVLLPPLLDESEASYYEHGLGRTELRELLYSYAALSSQWRASGAHGLVWTTGVTWLDGILDELVAELVSSDSAHLLSFAEDDRHGN